MIYIISNKMCSNKIEIHETNKLIKSTVQPTGNKDRIFLGKKRYAIYVDRNYKLRRSYSTGASRVFLAN